MSIVRAVSPYPRSLLVVLPTWVGDFVMATPFLRVVRKRFADARITFLLEPNLRDLVRGGDWMDECIEWPAKEHRRPWTRPYRALLRTLRSRAFDWAILLPNSFSAALVARLAGVKRRIGYDRDGRGWLLTDRVPVRNRRKENVEPLTLCVKGRPPKRRNAETDEFAIDNRQSTIDNSTIGSRQSTIDNRQSAAIPDRSRKKFSPVPLVEYYADLAEAIGCDRPGDDLELFTTPDCDESVARRLTAEGLADHHPLVVISPGAKYGAAKCWLPERFAAVADRLIEHERAAVVVTCGPGEEPIARAIGEAMKHRALVLDRDLLSLGELKSLIRCCDLLIGNDAGPRHFAKAFGVGLVTVFGPTHPYWTATNYGLERIVRIDIDCGPCQERVCPLGHLNCMKGVSVETVFEAAQEVLAQRRRPSGGTHGR